MKKLVLLMGMIIGLFQFSNAQNVETVYGLNLADTREKAEAHIKSTTDFKIVERSESSITYQIAKKTELRLKFVQGYLFDVRTSYPPKRAAELEAELHERFGLPHSTIKLNSSDSYWEFDGWRVSFSVYEGKWCSVSYYIRIPEIEIFEPLNTDYLKN